MANKAAWLNKKGAPLEVGPSEDATPGADEVLVQNRAVAVNPVDWKMADSGLFIESFPVVLGCDIAGEVVKVGSNVKAFQVGDRVIGHCVAINSGQQKFGGFQNFTVVPSNRVAKLPSNISFSEGAVLPLAVSTAADGLCGSLSDGKLGLAYPEPQGHTDIGSILVVYGASSSVGAVTVQLAVACGVEVIATASERNFQFVHDAGASAVFDYNDAEVVNKIIETVQKSGKKFVGVYDAIALDKRSYHITVPIVNKLGGTLAAVLSPPTDLAAGVKSGGIFALSAVTDPVWANFITPALEQGTLKCIPKPQVVGTGLESIQAGLDANKKGVSASKIVIEL